MPAGSSRRARAAGLALTGALVTLAASPSAHAAKPTTGTGAPAAAKAAKAPRAVGPKLLASGISAPPKGATSGSSYAVTGTVVNDGTMSAKGPVTLKLTRNGAPARTIGRARVSAAAGTRATYRARVKVPTGLPQGSYIAVACVLEGGTSGPSTCVASPTRVVIGRADPIVGRAVTTRRAPRAAAADTCVSGAHTLSAPGAIAYPEQGNGGYTSIHTDLNLRYDAVTNLFLTGNNVELTQLATQCLNDFSLDFELTGPGGTPVNQAPGPNLVIGSITIDGVPATWAMKQPTYPGDPNGQDDPDPNAHKAGLVNPVNATINKPPACSGTAGTDCPATKLVITPATPIPAGTTFKVKVNYTGRPGTHRDPDGSTEGWFRIDQAATTRAGAAPLDGSFVTTEPIGNQAWMPLNNHPTAKPTYDSFTTTNPTRTVAANGEYAGFVDNPADADFPSGSRTYHWHSPAPIANYLVTNSVGSYDLNQVVGTDGRIFNQLQASAITTTQKATNQAVLAQQNDITDFQKTLNGPFPFTTDGVVIGLASVAFEEEMQTMITFQGGTISLGTLHHENAHQWWGDSVSEASFNLTALKEGFAQLAEYHNTARTAATNAGGITTTAGAAAFRASLNNRFNTNYASTSLWANNPFNPTAANLFSTSQTYTRPGTAYLSMRAILGQTAFVGAVQKMQRDYGGGNITAAQLVSAFQDALPNQSAACRARIQTWETQWFETQYPSGGGANRPQLTGPGLANNTAGGSFYDPQGSGLGCEQILPAAPTPAFSVAPVGGKYTNPTVTLAAPAAARAGTQVAGTAPAPVVTYKLDGGPNTTYTAPFTVTGDGTHTIAAFTTDVDGNVGPTQTTTITVATPPVTTATSTPPITGGAVDNQAVITLSATDDAPGPLTTEYALDGGAFQPYTAPFTVSGGGGHTVLYRSTDAAGNTEATRTLSFVVNPTASATVGGTVSSTLSLNLATTAASFGALIPGVAQDYATTATATVTATSGDSTLTATDLSSTAPGRLVNGAFALQQPLRINATDAASPTSAFAPLGSGPLSLLTFPGPVSNDAVTIGLRQAIGANEPLRTGTYSKTVLFTLATTTP